MNDKAWKLSKELAREVMKARGIKGEIGETFAVMQAQDFYNLFNICKNPKKYNMAKVARAMEKELEK